MTIGFFHKFFLISAVLTALSFVSCGNDSDKEKYKDFGSKKSGPGNAATEARKRAKEKHNPGLAAESEAVEERAIKLPELSEVSFIVDSKRRDPFSPFFEILVKNEKAAIEIQRDVKLKDYDISSLKLIGIITNIGDDRAMVTTPDNNGYVLKRGDYLGRPDFVKQGNDGDLIQVNWRVARIHGSGKEEERGIYLVRDDPSNTQGVDVTRFVPLHPTN